MQIIRTDGCNNTSVTPAFRFNLAEVKCTLPKGISREKIAARLKKFGDASDVYLSEGTRNRRPVWLLSNFDETVQHDKIDTNFLTILDELGEALANKIVQK